MISIIIPTFNRSDTVLIAIQSILNRNIQNLEIIIIDDASQDDTKQKIEELNNDSITYVRNNINLGTAQSKLKGIEAASGNYIGFLDDDDIWTANKINFSDDILTNSDILLYDFKMNHLQNIVSTTYSLKDYGENFHYSVAKNIGQIFMQACLFKKEFLMIYKDKLDVQATPSEDWDFFITLAQHQPTVYYTHAVIFQWNLHKNSQSYDVVQETKALEYIIKKHILFFEQYPSLLGTHYRIIGNRLYYEKEYARGDKYIKKAFRIYPYKIKNMLLTFLTVFPLTVKRPLINKYVKKII